MSAADIDSKIAEYWSEGMGLSEAQDALRRLGVSVEREDIRLRYVMLTDMWAGR